MEIGQKVKVVKDIMNIKRYIGKIGKVTSIGREKLGIHVTLDGTNGETDFAKEELQVID